MPVVNPKASAAAAPDGWYADARAWLGNFWHASESYDYHKTRSCVSTEACHQRMLEAVRNLERLGVVWLGRRMPTLDEFERGCGRLPAWEYPPPEYRPWSPQVAGRPPWQLSGGA